MIWMGSAKNECQRNEERSMTDLTTTHLRDQILEAFDDVPYPGDDKIIPSGGWITIDEAAVKKTFKGTDWRRLPASQIEERGVTEALGVMTPEAVHYFMPG